MTDYEALLKAVENYYGSGSDQWVKIARAFTYYDTPVSETINILKQVDGVQLTTNKAGDRILNIAVKQQIQTQGSSGIGELINSNTQMGVYANSRDISVPANMSITSEDTVAITSGVSRASGVSQGLKFVTGKVLPAVAAVGSGITLGKVIDSALYNANPEFWNSHNLSSMDPETWSTLAAPGDTLGEDLFNVIFGLSPEDKTATLYVPEDVFAYMAQYMNTEGLLSSQKTVDDPIVTPEGTITPHYPVYSSGTLSFMEYSPGFSWYREHTINGNVVSVYAPTAYIVASAAPSVYTDHVVTRKQSTGEITSDEVITYNLNTPTTLYGKTFYTATGSGSSYMMPYVSNSYYYNNNKVSELAYILLFGTAIDHGIAGIRTQSGANTPRNAATWTNTATAKQGLKQQYPYIWDDAVEIDTIQEDGTLSTTTYVPISTPETTSRNDSKPVTGDIEQGDIDVTDDSTGEQQKTITDPATDGDKSNPNPPDTGTGDGPVSPIPAGSASALWSVYNPTQAQLNSFGAWLWSTNFVDQLKKLFNDPMQSIIGVSKVFAPPPVSGNGTIVVGYLDSNVPSNIVGSQYSTVDCGSVSCFEYFGNVFDYDPYTKVSIYLPFIGIRQLNTAEVMRSVISVRYHVDVLSGACLAEVEVTRDGNSAALYQFAGNAAVQYPVSSGSYMGIVSGVLGVAGAVAGAVASGGALTVPMLAGSASGLMHSRATVEHSGSLSGNAGAMGGKTPYLIIVRPQTALADRFEELQGYPANKYVKLSTCSGFTVVNSVHVENIEKATTTELSMIETALKDGVII